MARLLSRYSLDIPVNRRDGADSRRNTCRKNENAKRSIGIENPKKKIQSNVQLFAVIKCVGSAG